MWRTIKYRISIVIFFISASVLFSQSLINYSVSRSTGISYNSIVSSGTPLSSWRYVGGFSQDDNRSNATNIGFDFWYNGVRYTQFSVSTNGYMDFSNSTADGGPTTGVFGYDNTRFTNTGGHTAIALAPMYDDMTTQGGGDPLGNSIKYELTGTAPNRVLTVEWINMAVYLNTTPDLNFQVKLYETTGVIEFIYGTMTPGTATWSYSCGINAATMTGPTAAQLLTQQTANTATFSNTAQNGLATIPATDSKLTFTPLTPANPTGNVTFSAITASSMTLTFGDFATNEVGYAIYRSTDDVTYDFIAQTAVNASTYNATGLLPSTTYYWKVYAVTEGALSTAKTGNQITASAGTVKSIATGNWDNGGTWDTGVPPTATDNVTISNTHTVTIRTNVSCFNLTVGEGTSGILQIGNNATARTFTVTGNITVANGATFNVNAASNTTHILNFSGNISNSGTFNMATDAGSLCNVTFNKNGNQTVSGSGATTTFNNITVNMGSTQSNTLEISSSAFTAATNFLTLTNGTFKYSSASTITPYSGNATIPLTSMLWINNASTTVNVQGTISLYGGLKLSAGTLNVGNANDENITSYGGSVEVSGGALNIAGSLTRINNVTTTSFNMSGGTLTVPVFQSTTAGVSPFMMDVIGSSFTMSGGTIVIQRSGAGNLGFLLSDGTFNVTDGTLQIGNASTPALQTIQVNSLPALAKFTVNSANATAQLAANLEVFNNFTITAGSFNANNLAFTIGGNWSNSGTFTPGTGTVTFNGTGTQTITKSGGETFYNFTVNKSSGTIVFANNGTITNAYTQTAGNINVGSNTLTLGTSTAAVGTLNYTAGTIIGKFRRWINATGTGISFPVGTASATNIALITFTNLTSGSLTVEFIASNPGSSGLPLSDGGFSVANQFTEGYWDLTAANALASTNFALELSGNGFTSYTIKSSTRIIRRANSGSAWTMNGTHVTGTAPTAKRTALSGLSAQFGIANTACSPFSATAITGSTSVCTNALAQAYSVTNTTGNTYSWTITGGAQAGGGTTNAITINYGSTGMLGSIQVIETNDCGDANTPVTLPVYINPIATSAISGLNSVAASQTGVSYSVTATPGYFYNWVITGGAQASGGTTNAITVNWGAAGAGNVQVTTTRTCGGTDVVNLPVTIRGVIVSATSGNWTVGGTWVGGVPPSASDFVQIAATHTVTMNGSPGSCTKLTIDGTATWTAANTTNVGSGGIVINGTGNITGSVAGNLTSTGGLTLNSTLSSTTVGLVLQTTANQTISGTGSLAKLTINAKTTNSGTLTVTGTLAGSDSLINGTSATLNIDASVVSLTKLRANAAGNTVRYGSAGAQSIPNITFHHLSTSGSGTKTLSASTTLNGNLSIGNSTTLDISTSNYSLNVAGNWTNSGTFQSRFGTVTLNGSSAQMITKTGGETFNNLTLSGAGSKTLANAITLNGNLTSGSTFDCASNTINLKGSWTNNGTFTSGTGTVNFNGTTSQTISGLAVTDFYNMDIATGAAAALSSAQRLKGTITLNGTATFNTNNQFTLVSTASKTANIATLATPANFTGTITMQRYVSGTQGYRYTGSAVGGTLSDLTPELRFDGFTGSTEPTYWCNVYSYNESVAGVFANGWEVATNITNPLTAGTAKAIYYYAANLPVTLDITGTPNKGNQSLPVTYNNSSSADDGWNLVSNPYPSTIDWDAAGWTRTNIQGNTYYVWDNATQNYASYPVGGPGVNGGTRYIASSQGFSVKASGASPVLNLTENVKVNNEPSPAFWKQVDTVLAYLNLNISSTANSYYDETLIRFIDGATINKDSLYDADKMGSTNAGVPYIASVCNDSILLSVNSFKYPSNHLTIPLKVKSETGGSYIIGMNTGGSSFDNACILLEDTVDNVFTNIKTSNYSFVLPATTVPINRFRLHIYPSIIKGITSADASCYNKNDGMIFVEGEDDLGINYLLKDNSGNIIHTLNNANQQDTIKQISAGMFNLIAESANNMCPVISTPIVINQPDSISTSITTTDVTCKGDSNGTATSLVIGGTGYFNYLWSNNKTEKDLDSLSIGTYQLTITDANNCTATTNVTIEKSADWLMADFIVSADTLYLPNNNTLSINNNSTDASFYNWNWGDGNTSTDKNPAAHNYTQAGNYDVTFILSNKLCSDTLTQKITVIEEPLSVANTKSSDETISIYTISNTLVIELKSFTPQNVSIELFNVNGQRVYILTENWSTAKKEILLPNLPSGNYIVKLTLAQSIRNQLIHIN